MFLEKATHFKTQDALSYYVNFMREQLGCDAEYEKFLFELADNGVYVAGNQWRIEDILSIAYDVATDWEEA